MTVIGGSGVITPWPVLNNLAITPRRRPCLQQRAGPARSARDARDAVTDIMQQRGAYFFPHTMVHTPSIAFRHLPPESATEGALFISAQLSTDAVSALRKVWVLI